MFYSTELLGLSVESERRFNVLINRCVRRLAGTNLLSMREKKTGIRAQKDLSESFGLISAGERVTKRLLKWLRKLARMGSERIPKKMLFAYPRPQDCHDASATV